MDQAEPWIRRLSQYSYFFRGNVMTKLAYIGFAAALATITCAAGAGEMGEMKMKDGEIGMIGYENDGYEQGWHDC